MVMTQNTTDDDNIVKVALHQPKNYVLSKPKILYTLFNYLWTDLGFQSVSFLFDPKYMFFGGMDPSGMLFAGFRFDSNVFEKFTITMSANDEAMVWAVRISAEQLARNFRFMTDADLKILILDNKILFEQNRGDREVTSDLLIIKGDSFDDNNNDPSEVRRMYYKAIKFGCEDMIYIKENFSNVKTNQSFLKNFALASREIESVSFGDKVITLSTLPSNRFVMEMNSQTQIISRMPPQNAVYEETPYDYEFLSKIIVTFRKLMDGKLLSSYEIKTASLQPIIMIGRGKGRFHCHLMMAPMEQTPADDDNEDEENDEEEMDETEIDQEETNETENTKESS